MRILAVNSIYHIPVSGINYLVKMIGNELIKKNYEYHILTLDVGSSEEKDFENGINVTKLPFSKYNTLSGYESLDIISYLLKNLDNYDMVHIHNYYSFWSLITALICRLKKRSFVFTPYYHGIRGNTKKGISRFTYDLYRVFGRSLFKWAEKVICISEYEKNLIEELVSISEDKFTVIPPGVDYIISNRDKKKNDENIRILYAGNLFESKGVQYIIKSLPVLIEHYNKNVNLFIVGDGIYKSTLINLINELDLTDSINFSSNLTDEELKKKYDKADIFVFLSSSEAYGMVVAEALAMGTPVIVTKRTALSEFLDEPGCFGVDYPPEPKEVANLILEIYNNDVKVGPLSNRIRTWDKVAEDYEKIYLELIK